MPQSSRSWRHGQYGSSAADNGTSTCSLDFTPLPTPPLIFDRTVFCELPPYPTEQEALTYLRCLEMKMGTLSGVQLLVATAEPMMA